MLTHLSIRLCRIKSSTQAYVKAIFKKVLTAFRLGMEWALKEERKAAKWKDGGDSMAGAMAGM
jgi:hypothetical protein